MYPFKCVACGHAFTELQCLQKATPKALCPECGGFAAFHIAGLLGIGVIDRDGVPTTVGQQAEQNARRWGRELTALKRAAISRGEDSSTVTGPPPE